MAKRPDTDWRIITAALKLGAEEGWRRVTLAGIAKAAKIPLDKLSARFPDKRAILDGFAARINQQVLDAAPDDGKTVRDRLFDLIMCRFDALEAHKEPLRAMLPNSHACAAGGLAKADPALAIYGLCAARRAMKLTLETAGVSTAGLFGAVKIKALMLVYLNALRIWLGDETGTMDKVMAQLDKSLARLESLAGSFLARRPGDGEAQPAD
jgi:AcrR family transcriptional regulator